MIILEKIHKNLLLYFVKFLSSLMVFDYLLNLEVELQGLTPAYFMMFFSMLISSKHIKYYIISLAIIFVLILVLGIHTKYIAAQKVVIFYMDNSNMIFFVIITLFIILYCILQPDE